MYRFLLITEGRFVYNYAPDYLEAKTEEELWKLFYSYATYTINITDNEGNYIDLRKNVELVEVVEVVEVPDNV